MSSLRDRILAEIPTTIGASADEIARAARTTDTTVRRHLRRFDQDGWLEAPQREMRERGPVTVYRRAWADTFFAPRALPQAIFFDNGVVTGPFCDHCGWPLTHHGGPRSRCPARVHPLLGGSNSEAT